MSSLITLEHTISSCDDTELNISRSHPLSFKYTYPKDVKLKGIVFIIPGFGEDTQSGYLEKLLEYTATTFGVLCVTVYYHCFYARPNNGASYYADPIDRITIENYFKEYQIDATQSDLNHALTQLDNTIESLKESGKLPHNTQLPIPLTSFPLHGEYQNFGVMQALDHLNVLTYLQNQKLPFEENYSVTLIGSSHGGYIAHLCAKFAPTSIDLVIDNSTYVTPPYNFFVGREYNPAKPEFHDSTYKKNLILYFFTKTHWSLEPNSPNFFSRDRYRIRDLNDLGHLTHLSQIGANTTKYISYHSIHDALAPFHDKQMLYKRLKTLGFDATLHAITDPSFVDGKFIKNLHHGMDMSIKELINRELPTIYQLHPKSDHTLQPIRFECDRLAYSFDFDSKIFCSKNTALSIDDSFIKSIHTTFLNNIAYLEQFHPDLYQKLAALDSAVEQNLYHNHFDLIFTNGSLEIVELVTHKSLYEISSDQYAIIATESINFSRDSGVFETFKKITISDEDLPKYASLSIYENNLSGHADLLNHVQKEASSEMKNCEKFIFFGVGLGTHITAIDAKVSAKTYFIIEDNLELFRLSLFATPYSKIGEKSTLVFSVFETKEEFIPKATLFLNRDFQHNHYLKYFHMLRHSEEKFVEFHLQIASASHHLFFYNSILEQYLRPLEYMRDGFNFLNILKTYPSLANKPVILLAAGPSLQKNIEWLQFHHQQFVIVALSAVLGILEKANIVPDIITHLDGFDESSILFDKLHDTTFINNSIFLISSRTPKNIVDILPKQNIFFFESGTNYKKEFGNLSAFCVGSTTYLLLLALGVSELYLLGLDLALDANTGKTHSDAHPQARALNLTTLDQEKDVMIFNDNIIEVPGNFDQKVFTTSGFATSIASVNATSGGFKKPSQHVYNLSHGAKFINTTPLEITSSLFDTLLTINKDELHHTIFQEFNLQSSTQPSEKEYTEIEKRFNNALHSKQLIEEWKKSEFDSIDPFLNSLTLLIQHLCSVPSDAGYDLAFIYQEYFKLTASYIYDFFNRKTLIHSEAHVRTIHTMFSNHLLTIVTLYTTGLKQLSKD